MLAPNSNALANSLLSATLKAELKRLELRTKRKIDSSLLGRYRSAFRGSGLVYSELREYQPGDEVKNIHWKATARTNKVYVKSYDEDRLLNVLVALDISNSTNFGGAKSKHLRALEFAALISLLANSSDDCLGLCLFSDKVEEYFTPKKSRSQLQRIMLALLKNRQLQRGTNIALALEHIRKHQSKPALIFLLSDFYSGSYERELRLLSFKHDLILVWIEDELDLELPNLGIIEFLDAESNQRCLLDTSSKKGIKILREVQLRRFEALQKLSSQCAVDLIRLNSSSLKPLEQLMRQRQARLR